MLFRSRGWDFLKRQVSIRHCSVSCSASFFDSTWCNACEACPSLYKYLVSLATRPVESPHPEGSFIYTPSRRGCKKVCWISTRRSLVFLLTTKAARSLIDEALRVGAYVSKKNTPGYCINPPITIPDLAGTISLSSFSFPVNIHHPVIAFFTSGRFSTKVEVFLQIEPSSSFLMVPHQTVL